MRRPTEWGSLSSTAITSVAGASSAVLASFSAATLAGVVPGTIVRIRGSVLWKSDQAAADEVQFGAVATSVVSEIARAASSVPVPSVNQWTDDQFFWTMALQNTGMAGVAAGRQHVEAIQFDNRAMRKLDDGDGIVVTCGNWGANGIDVAVSFRILFMKGRSR